MATIEPRSGDIIIAMNNKYITKSRRDDMIIEKEYTHKKKSRRDVIIIERKNMATIEPRSGDMIIAVT